jgi:hypothetical protein
MNSKGEGIPPGNDEFLVEQMGRFSEIFGSPIGMNGGAPDVESPKKKNWFESPAATRKPVEPVVEKAPPERVEPPIVPLPVIASVESDPSMDRLATAILETPRPAADYHVTEKSPPENVELPVFFDLPVVAAESHPFPVRLAKTGEAEKSSFLGECEALWRHLSGRSGD